MKFGNEWAAATNTPEVGDLKERILSSLSADDVYGDHVALRRSGKAFVGLCCFHSEKTPSFTVSAKLRFKCWGCDKQGSAFDFVMAVERTDFRGALERLAAKAGISLNGTRPKQPPKNIERPSATESHASAITIADLACDKKIPESELARMGIKNISNGVLIPYFLSDKSLAARQRIRTALSAKKGSRWDNNDGPVVPYGMWRLTEAREAGFLCLAEGESDPWTLWHHGFPCLGIPGASMTGCLESAHVAGIPKLFIMQEPDAGGTTFVAGLAKRLTEIGWTGRVLVVSLAPFKDPNDLHKSNPELFPETFLARLDAAVPLNLEMVGVYGQLASQITPKRIEWLWRGRIPQGKITVLDGDPGLGKSALTLDLAARVTTGYVMPDGSPSNHCDVGSPCQFGGVLVLNAEDDEADTIVPRLVSAGAALDRVRILKTLPGLDGERQLEIPGDIPAIEKAARSVHARLIIIDPLMAFLAGSANSYRDQDVRRALAPLAGLAERLGAAVVIVRHLTKNSAEGNPLYRGGASIGIIGAARSGLLVARDPDDETGVRCVLASTKANLGVMPASLGYSIQPHGDAIRVQWTGASPHRASKLLNTPDSEAEHTAVGEAIEFLRSILSDGALDAKKVLAKAKGAGFSDKTLQRAKGALNVESFKQGFGPGSNWMWNLRANTATESSKMASLDDLAIFGQPPHSKPIESSNSSKVVKFPDVPMYASKAETPDGCEEWGDFPDDDIPF